MQPLHSRLCLQPCFVAYSRIARWITPSLCACPYLHRSSFQDMGCARQGRRPAAGGRRDDSRAAAGGTIWAGGAGGRGGRSGTRAGRAGDACAGGGAGEIPLLMRTQQVGRLRTCRLQRMELAAPRFRASQGEACRAGGAGRCARAQPDWSRLLASSLRAAAESQGGLRCRGGGESRLGIGRLCSGSGMRGFSPLRIIISWAPLPPRQALPLCRRR